jgi:transposase
MTKQLFAGIDLHSNNLVIGIVDQEGRRIKDQRLACDLKLVTGFLKPYRKRLKGLAVESTYNWYWLVDGLRAQDYPVRLANPAKMEQYDGIKHAGDTNDAYYLAELQRLNILPTGYIYDRQLRPVRDLLRRRMGLVRQRTALMLSFQSLYTRTTGQRLSQGRTKAVTAEEAPGLYEHPANRLIAQIQKEHMEKLSASITKIETEVQASARRLPCHERITTLPGVGRILGMTITMEMGPIERFPTAGDFASYCRTVDAKRMSNNRKKGDNNQKCGNKYLAWAFVEAANFAKRNDGRCQRWFDRKAGRSGSIIATKALACKLAKAAWHVVRDQTDYDPERMLPGTRAAVARTILERRRQPVKGLASPQD